MEYLAKRDTLPRPPSMQNPDLHQRLPISATKLLVTLIVRKQGGKPKNSFKSQFLSVDYVYFVGPLAVEVHSFLQNATPEKIQ